MHWRAQVLEKQTGDLQRQLLVAQSELKAAREDAQIQDLDKSHLKAQLTGTHIHLQQCLLHSFLVSCAAPGQSGHGLQMEKLKQCSQYAVEVKYSVGGWLLAG